MQTNSLGLEAIVWSQPNCQYCRMAKAFLELRGYTVEVRDIKGRDWNIDDLRKEFPGASSVPQIKVDGDNVGGYLNLISYFDKI